MISEASPQSRQPDESMETTGDPIADLLAGGLARTVAEAEETYLNAHLDEIVALVKGPLSDDQLREHPLIVLLFSRGSRGWEDSLR